MIRKIGRISLISTAFWMFFICPGLLRQASAQSRIELKVGKAFLAAMVCRPKETATKAAVYSHGAIVEQIGHRAAAQQGYDVASFCSALADAGMLALVPLRRPSDDPVEVLKASRKYLLENSIEPRRIALVGFSRGGGLTLQSAAKIQAPGPIVLMSPALYGDYISDFKSLRGPILVTLGQRDPEGIRNRVLNDLAPLCQSRAESCTGHFTYPGNHKWFWMVREEYWGDIKRFFDLVLP